MFKNATKFTSDILRKTLFVKIRAQIKSLMGTQTLQNVTRNAF